MNEEHGSRELFPNYQSNTDIFVWILRLQPNKLSIDHRTDSVFEDDGLVDGILSYRIELLWILTKLEERTKRSQLGREGEFAERR